MCAEIINLRQARRRKDRAEKEIVAAENRRKFGQTKSGRRLDAAMKDLDNKKHDGLRIKSRGPLESPDDGA